MNFNDLFYYYRTVAPIILNAIFPCTINLGLNRFSNLSIKSQGVSGDVIARGEINELDGLPVVIKFFSTKCPYGVIKNSAGQIIKITDKNVINNSEYEIGNILLLTRVILLSNNPITPTSHLH